MQEYRRDLGRAEHIFFTMNLLGCLLPAIKERVTGLKPWKRIIES